MPHEIAAAAADTGPDDLEALVRDIRRGDDPDVRDARRRTPVMAAALLPWKAAKPLVEALVAAGADLHAEDADGMTAADIAAREGRLAALGYLALAGALPAGLVLEDLKLQRAVVAGGAEAAAKAIARGADPCKPMAIGVRALGFSPLAAAMEKGDLGMALVLLDGGASPDAPLWTGGPAPLDHCARQAGDPKMAAMARLLITRGADLETLAEPGSTPLHRLAAAGWDWAVGVVLDQGAEANAANVLGVQPLGVASLAGDAVRLLLGAGAKANAIREDGGTALHECARKGLLAPARLLLEHGADPDARDAAGFQPLGVMVLDDDLLGLLLEHGANPDAPRLSGGTALDECVGNRRLDACRMLLKAGANPNAARNGKTPLRIAVEAAFRDPALDAEMAGFAVRLIAAGADVNERATGIKAGPLWMRKPGGGLVRVNAPEPDDGVPLVWLAVGRPAVLAALLAGGAGLGTVASGLAGWTGGEFPLMTL